MAADHVQHMHKNWKRSLPWHSEEGGVEAIDVCQLVFLSLEGF